MATPAQAWCKRGKLGAMNLVACPTCRRHVRVTDASCPFCASPSRLPRVLLELGLAATASVGLAACYGAPARYHKEHDDPNAREEHAFRLQSEAGALTRIDASAKTAGCSSSPAGDTRRQVRCGKVEALVEEDAAGLAVRCRGTTEEECKSIILQLAAPPPAP
jgi:hypothetical protein